MSNHGTTETDKTPDQLRAEIEQTREQLAETVEQLAAKADVKTRAHEAVEEKKREVRERASNGPAIPIAAGVVALVAVALVLRRRRGALRG
jgi:uncharacterized protein (TIGR03382 family)